MTGLILDRVRISNFRSLREIEVPLLPIAIAVGENNSGKTSFLEALAAAIGSPRRALTVDDVFLEAAEAEAPKDRRIRIDVRFRPADQSGVIQPKFPPASNWTGLWGPGIGLDAADNDFVAIRTETRWSSQKADYETDRRFILEWPAELKDLDQAKISTTVSADQLDAVPLHYMDAKRDIEDDLRRQGSFWRRLIAELGISEKEAKEFETALQTLNAELIAKSEVLAFARDQLDEIQALIAANPGAIDLLPVAPRLRDITRNLDISFATQDARAFPLAKHGMGTRSVATLLVFKAFTLWRQKHSAQKALHPLLALEEPEAHLHPQAQRAVFDRIQDMPGQKIVSTHSPYFASRAPIGALRHFGKAGPETKVTGVDLSGLSVDEVRRIERAVISARGEILFARAVALFEGETEELALPILAEKHWNQTLHDLGFAFLGVGGAGAYLPFLRVCIGLSIPWVIFTDGDDGLRKAVSAMKQVGVTDPLVDRRLIALPLGEDLEGYLLESGYIDQVRDAIVEADGDLNCIADFIAKNDKQARTQRGFQVVRDYSSAGGERRAIYDMVCAGKTRYARFIAARIAEMPDASKRVPSLVLKLLSQLRP